MNCGDGEEWGSGEAEGSRGRTSGAVISDCGPGPRGPGLPDPYHGPYPLYPYPPGPYPCRPALYRGPARLVLYPGHRGLGRRGRAHIDR